MKNQTLAAAIAAIRPLAPLALYGDITAVTCSVFLILAFSQGMCGQLPADPGCRVSWTMEYLTG